MTLEETVSLLRQIFVNVISKRTDKIKSFHQMTITGKFWLSALIKGNVKSSKIICIGVVKKTFWWYPVDRSRKIMFFFFFFFHEESMQK